jgi:hypothetical protein
MDLKSFLFPPNTRKRRKRFYSQCYLVFRPLFNVPKKTMRVFIDGTGSSKDNILDSINLKMDRGFSIKEQKHHAEGRQFSITSTLQPHKGVGGSGDENGRSI